MRFLPLLFVSTLLLAGEPAKTGLMGFADITLNEKLSAKGWTKSAQVLGPFTEYSYAGPEFLLSGVPITPKVVTCKNGKVVRLACTVTGEGSAEEAFETLKAQFNREIGEDKISHLVIPQKFGPTDRGFVWKGPKSTATIYLGSALGKPKITLSWYALNQASVDGEMRSVIAGRLTKQR